MASSSATSFVGSDRGWAEARLEKDEQILEVGAYGDALAPLHDRIVALAPEAGRGLDEGEDRTFVGAAEHREQSGTVALIDGIVAPLAAHDLAAVEGEELLQLGPAEEDPPKFPSMVAEA
jgi:hypothetical protein